jgi:PAS domain S-box-containing protein
LAWGLSEVTVPVNPLQTPEAHEASRLVALLHETAFAFQKNTRRIVAWNAHARALFGHDESQALELEVDALLGQAGSFEGDGARPATLVMRRQDGSLLPVRVSFSPISGSEETTILAIVRCDAAEPAAPREAMRQGLPERETLLRSVFERAATGIALTDLNGQFIECNEAFQELVGFKQRELRHLTLEALSHPEDRPMEAGRFRDLLEGGQDFYDVTKRMIRKDGTVIWGQATASLVKDTAGKPLYCIELVNDITELRRDGQRAAIQLTMTQILAENPPANMALVQVMQAICKTLDWQIGEYWTPEGEDASLRRQVSWQVPGFNASEFNLFGQHYSMSAGEGLPGRVWSAGRPAWISDVLRDNNFLRRRMAEQAGITGALAFPVQSALGSMGVMVFAYRDFRQPDDHLLAMLADFGSQLGQFLMRKQAEKQLKLLGAIVNSAGEAIIGTDLQGIITSWNPSAQRLFGYSAAEAIGTSCFRLFPPDRTDEMAAALEAVRRGAQPSRMETLAVSKFGASAPIRVRLAPITDDDGRLSGLWMTAFQTTDRQP